MATVLIAGGTGLIGQRLSILLRKHGYTVRHLSRRADPTAPFPQFRWDPSRKLIDPEALEGVDHLINLAGAGIADRPWTAARKQLITSSRVESNLLLHQEIAARGWQPQSFIASAAIGYYGDRPSDQWITENEGPGEGFLAESCIAWEDAIQQVRLLGVRTVTLRTGVVLSLNGGAVPKLVGPLRWGLGTIMGNGKQWYAWIHIDDLCQMFVYALENVALQGVYNAVAPEPVRNAEFTRVLARQFNPSALTLPAPSWALRLALGEMADVVLTGARVSARRIQSAGFAFKYPDLPTAVANLAQ